MREIDRRLIIDGKGTEERVLFPIKNPLIDAGILKRPTITSYEDALAWNKQAQEHEESAMGFLQEYAHVKVEPKGNKMWIVNFSDIHWGHKDVDYNHVDHMFNIVEQTPDTYITVGWNLLDAAIPAQFPDGVMWSSQTAQEQVYTFREKLKKLHGMNKILGGIGDASCHEGWTLKKTGWAIYKELFDGIDVPLLYNGGYMDVSVGEQTYRTAMFHKIKYWSQFNKTHGGDRAMDRIVDAEIVFTSHMHFAATGQSQRYSPPFSKDTAVVASGTCKLKDRWARAGMGVTGEPIGQGIILWGDKHVFNTTFNLDAGAELMRT